MGKLVPDNFSMKKVVKPSHDFVEPNTRGEMLVCPTDICASDLNPRVDVNPKYEEIKASILAMGDLENPIPISWHPERKPGAGRR